MRIRFLGTGAAEGTPAVDCDCNHCTRARNKGGRLLRRRTAVLFSLPGYELLMDTPPEIREILDAYHITKINGIFITHEHFDHSSGLEEFLHWPQGVDLFVEPDVYQRIHRGQWDKQFHEVAFHIAFHAGVPIHFNDFHLIPFEVRHETRCFGLAIYYGNKRVVHLSDSGRRISNFARTVIEGADILVAHTPFFDGHEDQSHISVQEAIALKEDVGAKRLILSHTNHHNLPHDELEAYVSQFDAVVVAYDGMALDL